MDGTWLDRVLGRLCARCDALRFRWHVADKNDLAFCVMLLLPVVAFGAFARYAYADWQARRAAELRAAELRCLAENVYYEARGEPLAGRYAVAEVTLNRVASSRFPDTVCDVVHESRLDVLRGRHVGAFSWTELESRPRPRGAAWQQALEVAIAVYDGSGPRSMPGALYYHADSIEPRWAAEKRSIAKVGNHVFYE